MHILVILRFLVTRYVLGTRKLERLLRFYFQMSLPKMNPSKHIMPIRMFIPIPNQKRSFPSDRLSVENCSGTSPVDSPLTAIQIQNADPSKKRNRSVPEYCLIAMMAASASMGIARIIAQRLSARRPINRGEPPKISSCSKSSGWFVQIHPPQARDRIHLQSCRCESTDANLEVRLGEIWRLNVAHARSPRSPFLGTLVCEY